MFTKEDTLVIKGVAILLMIWLHLFIQNEDYTSLFFTKYGGVESLLARAAGMCVTLYIFLSGYGLYISYTRFPNLQIKKRIVLLYINLFLVAFIFIPLGLYLNPTLFEVNIKTIASNLIGWNTTWNREWWFLLPYIILICMSKHIFLLIKNKRTAFPFLIFNFLLYILIFVLSYYNIEFLKTHDFIRLLFSVLKLLFAFSLGAYYADKNVLGQIKNFSHLHYSVSFIMIVVIVLFIVLRSMISHSIINPFFGVFFITVLVSIKCPDFIKKILIILGIHSTNMWLVHTFFCIYIFQDFIYNFRYSLLIFLVTVLLSLFTSLLIQPIVKRFQQIVINYYFNFK